ncbi:hypothetical protein CspHIS471_0704510 [Cutaneotrichosporon sp. HIS471]|nr:hypothetical protein CspHIS471_0704510 [Cutaneotrichosporon sp. HIS471]
MAPLCTQCLIEGRESALVVTADHFTACTYCGAIDEQATSVRNTAQYIEAFGTLLHDDERSSLYKETRERQHESFINDLLHMYLVDQTTRIIHHNGSHFKAGVRSWYNKMRAEEEAGRQLKGMTTSNGTKKAKIRVALAILYTIQDSNITLVNSRLNHVKKVRSQASNVRGDGQIMAPAIGALADRTTKLGSDHLGYIDSKAAVRSAHRHCCKVFNRKLEVVDLLMSQVLVMGCHIERLAKLDWAERLRGLSFTELKAASERKGITLETAGPDDFLLDSTAWEFMKSIDWRKTLEAAFHLYCATCVVGLWGAKTSADIASALLFWGITAAKQGEAVPQITGWVTEIGQTFSGGHENAMARRSELKDMMVAWSTSIPDIGLPMPLIAGPSRGKAVGDGLRGFGGDRKRPIPEYQMAGAAAPIIMEHWRDISQARLVTRVAAIPIDIEFCMASKLYANRWAEIHPQKRSGKPWAPPPLPKSDRKLSAADQKMKKALEKARSKSRAGSKASSRACSVLPPSESTRASPAPSSVAMSRTSSFGQASSSSIASFRSSVAVSSTSVSSRCLTREGMLQRMLSPRPQPIPAQPEPSIEELLAQHDDSSDDEVVGGRDADGESDEEWEGWLLLRERRKKNGARKSPNTLRLNEVPSGAPFAFSISADGSFLVAGDEPTSGPVVPVSRKRPASPVLLASTKRSRVASGVPPTPPLTLSTVGRTPSPALTVTAPTVTGSSRSARPSPTLSESPLLRDIREISESPSLRSISRSPALSQRSLPDKLPGESEESSYACLLRREREQYITYNIGKERNCGFAMSQEVDQAMDVWVEDAKAKGRLPTTVGKEYLASLGIHGDPRKLDLGPFINKFAETHGWSPTTCLLRLGIKPREFPHHLLVHSLITTHEQLGNTKLNDVLAPIGDEIDDEQLETELDVLFEVGGEPWRALFLSDEEADDREKVYLEVGAWSYDRTVPEGPANRLDGEQDVLETLQKRSHARRTTTPVLTHPTFNFPKGGSTRINYDALRRLENGGDEKEEEDLYDDFVLHGAPGLPGLLAEMAERDVDGSDDEDDDDLDSMDWE